MFRKRSLFFLALAGAVVAGMSVTAQTAMASSPAEKAAAAAHASTLAKPPVGVGSKGSISPYCGYRFPYCGYNNCIYPSCYPYAYPYCAPVYPVTTVALDPVLVYPVAPVAVLRPVVTYGGLYSSAAFGLV